MTGGTHTYSMAEVEVVLDGEECLAWVQLTFRERQGGTDGDALGTLYLDRVEIRRMD